METQKNILAEMDKYELRDEYEIRKKKARWLFKIFLTAIVIEISAAVVGGERVKQGGAPMWSNIVSALYFLISLFRWVLALRKIEAVQDKIHAQRLE